MSQPRSSYAIGAGLFILLGFAALAYLATQTTSLANYSQGDTYALKAHFTNIGQLKLRAPVKIAGVRIGSVEAHPAGTGQARCPGDPGHRHPL